MEYRHVVAVTGLSGLYVLVSTKNDGAIVRGLADNKIKFISSRLHQITPLESIEIYTTEDKNVRLHEVFEKIKEDDAEVLALNKKKDDKATRALFGKILPEFDQERVYTSDIRKVYKWYEILKNANLLDFESLKQALNAQTIEADVVLDKEEDIKEEAPKKKTAAKKSKKEDDVEVAAEEAPKKKTAAKKSKKKED
jgi:hypothetical protein